MKRDWIYLLCIAFLIAAGCSKKVSTTRTFIIGQDTLTAEKLLSFVPDTITDSLRIQKAIRWISLAGKTPSDTGSIYSSLAERLSLQTGNEWTATQASLLYSAAEKIKGHSEYSKNTATLESWADSLVVASLHNSKPALKINIDTSICFKKNRESEAKIYSSILDISQKAGDLLADFLSSPDAGVRNISSMIKGLVSNTPTEKVKVKEKVSSGNGKKSIDNPVLVLKYRDQKSIRDSIEKHSPDIRSLYKKFLKTDSSIEGVVLITFRVNSEGEVMEAQIKNSQIKNPEFLKPLQEYVRTIHFKSIPKDVGNMTFDFPFEFNSEM